MIGVVIVISLALFRADLVRAATTGTRRKRKLIAAGIAILTMLGLISCSDGDDIQPRVTCYKVSLPVSAEYRHPSAFRLSQQVELLREQLATGTLEPAVVERIMGIIENDMMTVGDTEIQQAYSAEEQQRFQELCRTAEALLVEVNAELAMDPPARWREFQMVTREAAAIASGRRGAYPFDEDGKNRLLGELRALDDRYIAAAQNTGKLSSAAADLLRAEVTELITGVQAKRPTEMRMASCYEPMMMPAPAAESLAVIQQRLELLQQLSDETEIAPYVIKKIITSIEDDLLILADETELQRLDEDEKNVAIGVYATATDALAKLQAQLPETE